MTKLRKIFLYILGIPKTLLFNFYYLPLHQAIMLPVLLSHRITFQKLGGGVKIVASSISFGMIQIGFAENRAFDQARERVVWHNEGIVVFKGNANFGNGIKIAVTGTLICGNNIVISGNSQIICGAVTEIDEGTLIGWSCMLLDYDAHKIYSLSNPNQRINNKNSIYIGKNVWIGARVSVLKGVRISNGCVIAANTSVYKNIDIENAILGGNPVKVIKSNIMWNA